MSGLSRVNAISINVMHEGAWTADEAHAPSEVTAIAGESTGCNSSKPTRCVLTVCWSGNISLPLWSITSSRLTVTVMCCSGLPVIIRGCVTPATPARPPPQTSTPNNSAELVPIVSRKRQQHGATTGSLAMTDKEVMQMAKGLIRSRDQFIAELARARGANAGPTKRERERDIKDVMRNR